MIHALRLFFKALLYNMKLRNKLMASLLLVSILPLFVYMLLASHKTSSLLSSHIRFSANQGFQQTVSFLSYKMQRIVNLSDVIIQTNRSDSERSIYTILKHETGSYDLHQQFQDMNYLTGYLRSFEDHVDVDRVRLYVSSSFFYSDENQNLYGVDTVAATPWFVRLSEENEKLLWCPPSLFVGESNNPGQIFSLARLIRDPDNYMKVIGVLRLDLQERGVSAMLEQANTVQNSITFIYNEQGDIVSGSDANALAKLGIVRSNSEGTSRLVSDWQNVSDKNLVLSQRLNDSDWTMVTIIPYTEILSESEKLRSELSWMVALFGAFACLIAFLLSRTMTRRLSTLNSRMKDVQTGNMDAIATSQGEDEIGELGKTYNYMLDKMRLMHKEQYELGLEMKNTELKALQSQINPHFLYNTLDLVNWMAQQNRTDEIVKIVKALSKFYRLTLNQGKDMISVRDELLHILFYMEIQNTRFYQQIRYVEEVAEEVGDYSIPKITLQPIIENAILHGILGKKEKEGTILVQGWKENQEIVLRVEDDGVGIPPERLDRLNREESSGGSANSGYGLKNVNERIKIYFGARYGISFEARPGGGTRVTVRIPDDRMSSEGLSSGS